MKIKVLLFLLYSVLPAALPAAPMQAGKATPDKHDSIRISLLTCSAGKEIYSLFGHTAIRYENYTQKIDKVFNYGVFNFRAPNFILRFALGETDYQLGVGTYERFAWEYHFLGRKVWQQVLNLQQEEKEKLVRLLVENEKPGNRVYRYNFFYDNCATRPRDMIEKAINGNIQYADDMTDTQTGITFRDQLHLYSIGHPWSRLGMDLCMGSQADQPISRRTLMFVPFHVQEYFRTASIRNAEGQIRPLVLDEEIIITPPTANAVSQVRNVPPQLWAWLLFAIVTAFSVYGVSMRKSLWGIDLLLFTAAGAAGCILAFLALFSQHPAVSPNYLLFVFHPLHLFCLPCMLIRVKKKRFSRYMAADVVVLTLFILLWGIFPQEFNPAVLPLVLCLLARSASNMAISKLTR